MGAGAHFRKRVPHPKIGQAGYGLSMWKRFAKRVDDHGNPLPSKRDLRKKQIEEKWVVIGEAGKEVGQKFVPLANEVHAQFVKGVSLDAISTNTRVPREGIIPLLKIAVKGDLGAYAVALEQRSKITGALNINQNNGNVAEFKSKKPIVVPKYKTLQPDTPQRNTKTGYLRTRQRMLLKLYKKGYNANEVAKMLNQIAKKTGFTFGGNSVYTSILEALGTTPSSPKRSQSYWDAEKAHTEAREKLFEQERIHSLGRSAAENPLSESTPKEGTQKNPKGTSDKQTKKSPTPTKPPVLAVPRGEMIRQLEQEVGRINDEIQHKRVLLNRLADSSKRYSLEEDIKSLENDRTPLVKERNRLLSE